MRIKQILRETIYNHLLLEAKSKEQVYDILCKKYEGRIIPYIIQNIMHIDPTKKFAYTQWALQSLINGHNTYDIPYLKLKELFDFAKENNDFQLQTFNTIDEAWTGYESYKGKSAYNIIYDDDKWIVYQPLTYEAERYIVWTIYDGASWCTANSEDASFNGREKFEDYTKGDSRLFIFVRKSDNALFQLSDEHTEFRNKDNDFFPLTEINLSYDIVDFFQNKMGIYLDSIVSDCWQEGFAQNAEAIGDSGLFLFSHQLWWDSLGMASPEGTRYDDISEFMVNRNVILAPVDTEGYIYDIYLNQDEFTGQNEGWQLVYKNAELVATSESSDGVYIQCGNYFGCLNLDDGYYDCIDNVKFAEYEAYDIDGFWTLYKTDGTLSLYSRYLWEFDYEITQDGIKTHGLTYFGEAVLEVYEEWISEIGDDYIKVPEQHFSKVKKLLDELKVTDLTVTNDGKDYIITQSQMNNMTENVNKLNNVINECVDKCLKKYLNETLNNFDAPLYHNTSTTSLIEMMKTNTIKSNYHRGYNAQNTHNGICFTRNKTYNPYTFYVVRLTFDTNKINKLSRGLTLVSYQDKEWEGLDEYEERLISRNGKPFVLNNLSDMITEAVVDLGRICEEIVNVGADVNDYIIDLKRIAQNNIFGDKLKIVDNLIDMNRMSINEACTYLIDEFGADGK